MVVAGSLVALAVVGFGVVMRCRSGIALHRERAPVHWQMVKLPEELVGHVDISESRFAQSIRYTAPLLWALLIILIGGVWLWFKVAPR